MRLKKVKNTKGGHSHIRSYSLTNEWEDLAIPPTYQDGKIEISDLKKPDEEGSENSSKLQQDEAAAKKDSEEKSEVICSVCFDNVPDSVFMDCGHGGMCYDCAIDIWKI